MRVADLRSILHYVPKFRGGLFVFSIDADVVSSENFPNVLLDLAVLRSLNINVVVVYGVASQIQELCRERNVTRAEAHGGGPADLAAMEVNIDATSRLLNVILQGMTTVDLRAASPNVVVAAPPDDPQRQTGRIVRIESRPIELFLKEDIVPVISALGFDGEGHSYLLDADELALTLAVSLEAAKVIYLTTVRMPSHDGGILRNISMAEADTLLATGDERFTHAQRCKLAAALEVCRAGIARAHVLPGEDDGAILHEVFSSEGIGTMVYADDYQNIRLMEKRDIRAVLDLVKLSVNSAELVKRTRADFVSALGDYWVLEIDGVIMGCVALHTYEPEHVGELACLYVRPNYTNRGYGRKLVHFVENLAAKRGLKSIFALSTQTFSFFEQKGGYKEVAPEALPAARYQKYEKSKRNSRVLIKNLSGAENALAMQVQDR